MRVSLPHHLTPLLRLSRTIETIRVLESSEELKDLERRIKTAYVNKERAAQFQEKMLLRKLDLDREQVSTP